jgi:hypothetical protein
MKGKFIQNKFIFTALIIMTAAAVFLGGCELLLGGDDTGPGQIPTIPQGVRVEISGSTIVVSWDYAAGTDGYTVYYYKDGDLFEQSVQVDTNSFIHTNPLSGTRYYYKVKARIGDQYSLVSEQISEILASYTFTVDVPENYFNSMQTSSADIEINGSVVGTINSWDLGDGYTSFDFTTSDFMDTFAVRTGTFYNYFDSLDDFASGVPDAIGYMFEVSKVALWAKSNWSWEIIGTGADVCPTKPSFSIVTTSVASNSFAIEYDPYEAVNGYTYDVYVSTEEYSDDSWTVIPLNDSTKVNTVPVNAETTSVYTVTGLQPATEYHVMVVSIYDGIENATQYARSVTTESGSGITLSDDADLTALSFNGGSLNEGFSSSLLNYTADVGNEVSSATITWTVSNQAAGAGMTIGGNVVSNPVSLSEGVNTILITVTAENGSTERVYSLAIDRAAAGSGGTTTDNAVYVSSTGSDSNDGLSSSTAVANLKTAASIAGDAEWTDYTLFAEQGVYDAGTHFDSTGFYSLSYTSGNITFSGGWDASFSSQTGYTTMDGLSGMSGADDVLKIRGHSIGTLLIERVRTINGGRGINIEDSANVTLSDVESVGNSASGYGAGIFVDHSNNISIDALVQNNTVTSDDFGGGVCIYYGDNVTFTGEISGNSSSKYGAGLAVVWGSNVTVSDAAILNNVNTLASGSNFAKGGGVYIAGPSDAASTGHTLENCTIQGNSAADAGAGVLIGSMTYNTLITGNTITGNILTTGGKGTAIYTVPNGGITISNNTISGNTGLDASVNSVIGLSGDTTNSDISITGNTIGGVKDGTAYALWEIYPDITGHSITNNDFNGDTLDYLYGEYTGEVIEPTEIDALNTPDNIQHDAATASGNTVSGSIDPGVSSDASLTALSFAEGSLNESFLSGTLSYTADVGNDVSSVTISFTAASGASVELIKDAATVYNPVDLDEGTNNITIEVTAEDSTTTETYTITIERTAPAVIGWTEGVIAAEEIKYYAFPVEAGGSYTVYWDDSYTNALDTFTCDIQVSAYEGGAAQVPLFTDVDYGYPTGSVITAVAAGELYLIVRGYSPSSYGSYALKVSGVSGDIVVTEVDGVSIPVELR